MSNRRIQGRAQTQIQLPRRRIGRSTRRRVPPSIPQLITILSCRHVFRFQNNAATSRTNFTRAQLLGILSMGTSTTTCSPLFGGIRINRISIWGVASNAAINTNTITLVWDGATGPSTEIHDTTTNAMYSPYISSVPPRTSSASSWTSIVTVDAAQSGTALGQGGEILFSIVSSQGTIVDLDVSLRVNDTPSTYVLTTVGLTAGAPVYLSLDNGYTSGAVNNFDPMGVRNFA